MQETVNIPDCLSDWTCYCIWCISLVEIEGLFQQFNVSQNELFGMVFKTAFVI